MKYVHYILVGNEPVEQHIAGLSKFSPFKVILLDKEDENRKKINEITEKLKEREIPFSIKKFENEREDLFLTVVSSSANYLTKENVFFAINKSVGLKEELFVVEAGIISPIGTSQMMGHGASIEDEVKALCYEVQKGDFVSEKEYDVKVVPFSKKSREMEKEIAQDAVPIKKGPRFERLRWMWHVFPVKMRIWKNKFKKKLGLR